MADSFSKKENFKKKQEKLKEKALRREERKNNSKKGKDLEDMIMYVDEFGQLSIVPPQEQERQEIILENIRLGAEPIIPEDAVKTGIVTFLSDKGYGFITENNTKDNVFFHENACEKPVKKGNKVSFEKEKSPKGFSAVNVQLIK
ncbi:cold-shock protein [uncultured Chryseobacterium sp.]|uniref:cold-shock protein n=1 Tax=uncultured Chryseobacterium sp. TaxID=259322 RepID=UPI002638AAD8|nr:cold shock domain-containing protein [uncultured Chryseobacterium sp.]